MKWALPYNIYDRGGKNRKVFEKNLNKFKNMENKCFYWSHGEHKKLFTMQNCGQYG